MRLIALILALLTAAPTLRGAGAARIKELAGIEGVRDNQLLGYGIVVGLAGTGDKRQTVFSAQSLANLLERMGVQISPQAILVRNTASVMITATLPPFAQTGSRLDVSVAAIGDAANLQGGLLLMTPLRGADGQVYAVAQGPVVTGGFVAKGGAGNSLSLNHPTVGRIPGGALVERAPPTVTPGAQFRLQLRQADFTTAARLTAAINRKFPAAARAEHAGAIAVSTPGEWSERRVEFLAEIERLTVEADTTPRIVVNERTGTIVLGKDVRIAPAAILHGALSVEIQTTYDVSQPAPRGEGKTTVVPQVGVAVKEEKARNVVLKEGATVEDLVKALTAVGSTARDIIAILQNLKASGALGAEIEVI
ncbi:MAG: flagellar basal body P-ring protein FlgI [Bryobacteraceae bacterium]|nr:flagellar basal body P-ring protein FlgI [Bryobacteraceae bacterium]